MVIRPWVISSFREKNIMCGEDGERNNNNGVCVCEVRWSEREKGRGGRNGGGMKGGKNSRVVKGMECEGVTLV